jgi:hypothetical protein
MIINEQLQEGPSGGNDDGKENTEIVIEEKENE